MEQEMDANLVDKLFAAILIAGFSFILGGMAQSIFFTPEAEKVMVDSDAYKSLQAKLENFGIAKHTLDESTGEIGFHLDEDKLHELRVIKLQIAASGLGGYAVDASTGEVRFQIDSDKLLKAREASR